MTFAAIAQLLLTYGPTVIPLAQKLSAAIAAGRGNETVTEADWTELLRLSALSSDEIYRRQGITPPPAK